MENIQLGEGIAEADIDEDVYSIEAIYGACFLFLERCYLYLSRPADRRVRVRLKPKGRATAAELEALVGELANELLNQVMRQRVGEENAGVREQYLARIFSGGRQNPTIAELLAELDAEELEDEPLEIAVPWEQKEDETPKDP